MLRVFADVSVDPREPTEFVLGENSVFAIMILVGVMIFAAAMVVSAIAIMKRYGEKKTGQKQINKK